MLAAMTPEKKHELKKLADSVDECQLGISEAITIIDRLLTQPAPLDLWRALADARELLIKQCKDLTRRDPLGFETSHMPHHIKTSMLAERWQKLDSHTVDVEKYEELSSEYESCLMVACKALDATLHSDLVVDKASIIKLAQALTLFPALPTIAS